MHSAVTEIGSHVQELVAAKLPRLHHHLQSIGCDMTIIGATDWILCLYSTSLPAEVRPCSDASWCCGLQSPLLIYWHRISKPAAESLHACFKYGIAAD